MAQIEFRKVCKSFGATKVIEDLDLTIEDGKFTGKIYSPIVLSGYVPELLKSITMMSENVKLSGGGFCGKGYKEWVKVSDGGPYIKATIDLG